MSLAESITTVAAKQHQLDYGRIRLWGSIAFMIVATVAGKLLAVFGTDVVLYSLVGTSALLFVAALLLPATPAPKRPAAAVVGKPAVSNRQFLSSQWFLGFLLATMLIQGSHAAYYVFATIHWRAQGLSDQMVGLLWGISVFSEIGFFAFGKRVVDRLGPINTIVLGGVAAALRWTVIGFTVNPVALGAVQLLHAVSFGASHFAAIRLISEKVDDQLSATGQGLYSAFIMGIGMGVFVLMSGPLFQAFGHQAFYLMSAVAVLGTGVMLAVRRLSFDRITAEPVALELRAATVNS
jgi:PPP family 3-phenylpropionic acid transporter